MLWVKVAYWELSCECGRLHVVSDGKDKGMEREPDVRLPCSRPRLSAPMHGQKHMPRLSTSLPLFVLYRQSTHDAWGACVGSARSNWDLQRTGERSPCLHLSPHPVFLTDVPNILGLLQLDLHALVCCLALLLPQLWSYCTSRTVSYRTTHHNHMKRCRGGF